MIVPRCERPTKSLRLISKTPFRSHVWANPIGRVVHLFVAVDKSECLIYSECAVQPELLLPAGGVEIVSDDRWDSKQIDQIAPS